MEWFVRPKNDAQRNQENEEVTIILDIGRVEVYFGPIYILARLSFINFFPWICRLLAHPFTLELVINHLHEMPRTPSIYYISDHHLGVVVYTFHMYSIW